MSDLQLGLAGIGAAVVIGVFLYNKWQERQYRREAQGSFRSRHEDVLMRPENGAGPEAGNAKASTDRVEPVLDVPRAEAHGGRDSAAELSETLDFIIPMESAEEIPGDAVIEAAAPVLAGTSRRVRWEGLDESGLAWEPVRSNRGYSALRAGLQLVDRRGAANAEDLAEFGAKVQDAAETIGARCPTPDTVHALAKATELDRFCADVDIRIAVHVLSGETPFSATAVRALAEEAGFALDEEDGVFRHRDAAGRCLCTLSSYGAAPFTSGAMETTVARGITLELDVPRARQGAFQAFRELATQFADALGGRIVDDNRRPLGDDEFAAIETQIESVYRSMQARGIGPGGPLALRLFS